jgi:hypothetical protein
MELVATLFSDDVGKVLVDVLMTGLPVVLATIMTGLSAVVADEEALLVVTAGSLGAVGKLGSPERAGA